MTIHRNDVHQTPCSDLDCGVCNRDVPAAPVAAKHKWMCTSSGIKYIPAAPRVEDVRIVDIAHHLSRLCRYTGAVKVEHYSVAEHSVHVSYCVPPHMAFMGLMHDAPEAYTNDLSRPLKHSLPDYKKIEALNWAVIAEKFGLPVELPREIHDADIRVWKAEIAVLMPPMPDETGYDEYEAAPVKILALAPNAAEYLFLQRYYDLTRFKDPLSRELHITLEGCAT